MSKPKYWLSWWWNADLYYCKVPDKTTYGNLVARMEKFTSAGGDTWFSEMVLCESEPQIGEYMPRKKLTVFLDNMERFEAERDNHAAIEFMEEMLEAFLMENDL